MGLGQASDHKAIVAALGLLKRDPPFNLTGTRASLAGWFRSILNGQDVEASIFSNLKRSARWRLEWPNAFHKTPAIISQNRLSNGSLNKLIYLTPTRRKLRCIRHETVLVEASQDVAGTTARRPVIAKRCPSYRQR